MFSHFLTRPVRFTISFLKLGCLSHLAFTYGVHAAPAAGPSMVPTFDVDGTWVAFDMTCRNGRGIRVGDLVTYIIPDESGKFSGVKRVIGMPGDVVAIEPGKDTFLQVKTPILSAFFFFRYPSSCLLSFLLRLFLFRIPGKGFVNTACFS